MAAKNDSKKTTKTAKAKKGDAKNSKKPKAPETAAPETTKVPEPVSPPPVTAPAATEGEVMDGHTVHEALKHVLNACPKADGPDGNPALAFVLLDRDTLLATDDFAHHKAFLPQPASTGPVKITRASLRGLQKKLDGELKSGAETSTAVTVVWSGLIVEVHGVGETHHVTLQKFDGGPDPKHLHLAASPVGDGVRVPLDLLRRVKWKGDRSVLVYTDPATGRVCLDAVAGPDTIYRAVVAATGHNLGIRQPSLPGVSATPKPPPQAPTPPAPGPTEPPAAPAPPSPTVPPLQGLPAGLAWLCVVVGKKDFAVFLRHTLEAADALSACPPWRVLEDAQQVVLGPVPRGAFLDALTARFDVLAVPYTTQPADAPRVYALAVGATPEPVRAALPGVVDAEFEEPEPTGQDGEEPPEVTVWIHEDAWNALTPEQRSDFEEPLAGSGVDWDGTDEYVFARVPRDEVLTTLQGIAEGHGVKLVVSATKPLDPPAGDFVDEDPDAEGDVIRVASDTWATFDADATARLIAPLEMARVVWEDRGAYHVTEPVTPRVAEALATALRELGCVELEGGRRANGGEVRTFTEAGA